MTDGLFDIKAGYVSFRNPIAIAPMAGKTDSNFANRYGMEAGLVTIGGYNLDEKTNNAARKMISRGREEFISDTPLEFLKSEIANTDIPGAVAVNVRSSSIEPLTEAAAIVRDAGGILELDAHCRQPEMKAAGAGEALTEDLPRLAGWVRRIKNTGVVLSVKIRANVVNNAELAKTIEQAGADIIHLDAMKEEAGADLNALRNVRDATRLLIIGNNSIRSFSDAKEMFSRGADLVSVARGVPGNPDLVPSLVDAVSRFQIETGWYNAPKHVCRGEGDLRGLAFCCLPVKPCAVHSKIGKLGLSPQEFADLKMEFAKGTLLEFGDSTCFGSLAWCCKISKPCYLRDGVLDVLGLSAADYMKLKKEMADYILEKHRSE